MSDSAAKTGDVTIIANTNQGYDGDVTPETAWDTLLSDDTAVLVDVRTEAEWIFVGTPSLAQTGKELVTIELQHFPGMDFNKNFGASLKRFVSDKRSSVFFICRSGARSRNAAIMAKQMGYEKSYNVAGGFEGDHDENRQRGKQNGWKSKGLPWFQG
ncbi:MAG: rhodanese-like domain-containing protein [Parvibaculales bacterium]